MMQESKPAAAAESSAAQRFSSANSDALTEILEDLQRQFGGRSVGHALMLAPEGFAPSLPRAENWAIYRCRAPAPSTGKYSGTTDSTEPAMLPFSDETFDTVCLFSVASLLVDRPELPPEIYRTLKPKGVVVVIEPVANFKFAPLPAGGPAQLVRRHLVDIGLRHVHTLASPSGLLAFAAATDTET